MPRIVFGGSCGNSRDIGREIAERLGLPFCEVLVKTFVDTEMYVRLPVEELEREALRGEELKGVDVIYVQSTAPAQSQHLIELFLTAWNIKQRKANSLDLVVPYLAHARQDKEFMPGEAISNKVISRIMQSVGVDRLFTVDVHFNRPVGEFLYEGLKTYNLTAARALAEYVRDKLHIRSPKIVIPDVGQRPIAKYITSILGNDIVFLRKNRQSDTEVSIFYNGDSRENLSGRDVVIFDDMVSTGKTIIGAAQQMRKLGATNIVLAVTHTLYVENAREKILEGGITRIVATDTIAKEDSVVSIAPVIAEALKQTLPEITVKSR